MSRRATAGWNAEEAARAQLASERGTVPWNLLLAP